jgi:hypothetical protein
MYIICLSDRGKGMLDSVKPYIEVIAASATILGFLGAIIAAVVRSRRNRNIVKWCKVLEKHGNSKIYAEKFETRLFYMYHFDTTECITPKNVRLVFNKRAAAVQFDNETLIEYSPENVGSFAYKIYLGARRKAGISFFFDDSLVADPKITCADVALIEIPYRDRQKLAA